MAASTAAIASAANAMDQGREGANHPVGLVNASDSSINMEPSSDRKVDPTRSERPAPRLGQAAAAAAGSRSSSGSFSSRVQPSLATKHNSEWNLQETIPTVRSERKCCFCCGHRPSWADRAWAFLDDPASSRAAGILAACIMSLILLSSVAFVLETVESIAHAAGDGFFWIEFGCILVFTVEFVARVLVCPDLCKFWLTFFTWVDFLAIAPFYASLALPQEAGGAGSLGVIRILRLVRVARVVKVSRYSASIRVFSEAMRASVKPLTMLVFLMSLAMILFASGVYYAELTDDGCREGAWENPADSSTCAQDGTGGWVQLDATTGAFEKDGVAVTCLCKDKNPYVSIPGAFWWCLVTMTTVGYGDFYPVTPIGKLVAVFTMLTGIIILALPITVIGTNFARVLRQIQHEALMSEISLADRNDDGVIDTSELKNLLKTLSNLAPDDEMARSIPASAEKLLAKYDADQSGVLEPLEMAMLKADLAKMITPAHPAYNQLLQESAQQLRELQQHSPGKSFTRRQSGSLRNRSSKGGSSRQLGGGTSSRRLHVSTTAGTSMASLSEVAEASPSLASPPVGAGAGAGAAVYAGPMTPLVSAKIHEMESKLDNRLVEIADVLNLINITLNQDQSGALL